MYTVVFRPFVGEVMVGKIKACTKEGVQVSMDFFDDVIIPSYSLQVRLSRVCATCTSM